MNVLVDTSVWSLALRRSPAPRVPEVVLLDKCPERGDVIVITGIVLQELLQGFQGPAQARRIVKRFSLLPVIAPEVDDHIEAAALAAGEAECRSAQSTLYWPGCASGTGCIF